MFRKLEKLINENYQISTISEKIHGCCQSKPHKCSVTNYQILKIMILYFVRLLKDKISSKLLVLSVAIILDSKMELVTTYLLDSYS